jgi:tetratricopeptide (TPR) repeat protein
MTRVLALFQLGDLRGVRDALAAAEGVALKLAQPAQLWEVRGGWALLELAYGNLARAEELIEEAGEMGEATVPDGAIPVHLMQRMGLRDFRGGLEASVDDLERLASHYPDRPVFRCALAYVHARLDDGEAATELDGLAADRCAALPFDQEWLFAVSLLAEACVRAGRTDLAPALYDLLLPWARYAVSDPGEGFRGALERDLGLLATALGRLDDASRHFDEALRMNAAMGAAPWLARTQADYTTMLRATGFTAP